MTYQKLLLPLKDENEQERSNKRTDDKGNGKECFTHLHGGLEYSYILPLPENMMTPICASQRIASSFAFLNIPILLLEKVTCRFVGFSIFFSSTFPRPIGAV